MTSVITVPMITPVMNVVAAIGLHVLYALSLPCPPMAAYDDADMCGY
jgi:hypothetical protein